MIRPSPELRRFELEQARAGDIPYTRALEIFTALWVEARSLRPDLPGPWEEDIEPDLAVARALNDRPPLP
jgi:hypothetical protein